MILLDTDVMIDVLRGYEPAKEWLKNAPEIGLPGLVVMELLQGCSNAREQRQLEQSLSKYRFYWPDEESCNRALALFAERRLSDNIGLQARSSLKRQSESARSWRRLTSSIIARCAN